MAPLTAAAQLIPRVVPVTPSEERWRAMTPAGIACSADALARLQGCDDAAVLQRWLEGAVRATSEAELFRS